MAAELRLKITQTKTSRRLDTRYWQTQCPLTPTRYGEKDQKTKRLKTLTGDSSYSISDLLQPQPKPKMAAPPDSPYSSSEEEGLDAPNEIPHTVGHIATLPAEDLQALATKGDIKALMNNILAFNADLDIIRENVPSCTVHPKSLSWGALSNDHYTQ
ncbi:Hypothetical predicted protein [Pelobates cultripes]|uniref:Uncharacterized protein n=1 Tax=Pelobates cultripes TaxID=61616 RepID=A0AAD1SG90_PELCU|nr:Hypothetical predicted protein [Pelobates cultripes]